MRTRSQALYSPAGIVIRAIAYLVVWLVVVLAFGFIVRRPLDKAVWPYAHFALVGVAMIETLLVLIAIPAVKYIALNAINEALRKRTLHVVLLFAIVWIASGVFLTHYQVGEEFKMYVDFGLGALTIFGMLIAIFIGVSLVPAEIEKRTIYTVLAKPVKRYQVVLGKYLGALAVIAAAVAIMGVVMLIALYFKQHIFVWSMLTAVLTTYFSLVLLTALVMMVSTMFSSIMTIVVAFVLWFIGSIMQYVHQVYEHAEFFAQKLILGIVAAILPNFHHFDLRTAIANEIAIDPAEVGRVLVYGIVYSGIVLALAMILFNEREV